MVTAVRAACPDACLKVILETGELKDSAHIRRASELAVDAGADFIKTSTGKVAVNATLEAADIMLRAIRDSRKQIGRASCRERVGQYMLKSVVTVSLTKKK